ncbi:MAG: hemerythrin domain-containing protein [Phycisphaerales bacterium]|nr:hemerythrin domain-containing protein [Phycisphaerales bacterium]
MRSRSPSATSPRPRRKHTEDEEESLFPRLRRCGDTAAATALGVMDRLHADHEHVAPIHAEVDRIGRAWLGTGLLCGADAGRLRTLLADLSTLYSRHIEVEEDLVFRAAAQALDSATLEQIGREMAARRGVEVLQDVSR